MNETSKTVKEHSFRALKNLDSNNTDLFGSMLERRKKSVITNSSSLKMSHCEHDPCMVGNQNSIDNNTVRLSQKSVQSFNPVIGQRKEFQPPPKEVLPHSKMLDTYYDMLLTNKKPFNRTKGTIVTPL